MYEKRSGLLPIGLVEPFSKWETQATNIKIDEVLDALGV